MRKSKPKKRYFLPDTIYKDSLVTQFVNNLMLKGKKSLSYSIFYDSLEIVENKTKEKGIEVWKKAIDNVMPSVEVKSRRIGGANFQVPIEVRPSRRMALAMRWVVDSARNRSEKSMALRLAGELQDASEGRGAAVRKREDTHRMAEANRAFAHYRY